MSHAQLSTKSMLWISALSWADIRGLPNARRGLEVLKQLILCSNWANTHALQRTEMVIPLAMVMIVPVPIALFLVLTVMLVSQLQEELATVKCEKSKLEMEKKVLELKAKELWSRVTQLEAENSQVSIANSQLVVQCHHLSASLNHWPLSKLPNLVWTSSSITPAITLGWLPTISSSPYTICWSHFMLVLQTSTTSLPLFFIFG